MISRKNFVQFGNFINFFDENAVDNFPFGRYTIDIDQTLKLLEGIKRWELLRLFRILVADDDETVRATLERRLYDGGYEPLLAANGAEALEVLDRKHVDLILLDLGMPVLDGFALLDQLRRGGLDTPILVLSSHQGLEDKKRAFNLGADDYVVKPADGEELLLRINALLRRARISAEHRVRVGETTLLYDSLTVIRGDEVIELPPKEFLILYKLLSYPNKIFTRRQLMDEIWDLESESDEHTVSVHINRLRDRFRGNPDFKIVTIRGLGYKAARLS